MGNGNTTAARIGAALLALALLAGASTLTNPAGGYSPARSHKEA